MALHEIIWNVSDTFYHEMTRTQEMLAFPRLTDMLTQAVQRYLAEVRQETWRSEFRRLQQQVRESGGFRLGETKDDVMATLREQRRELFAADYADMY